MVLGEEISTIFQKLKLKMYLSKKYAKRNVKTSLILLLTEINLFVFLDEILDDSGAGLLKCKYFKNQWFSLPLLLGSKLKSEKSPKLRRKSERKYLIVKKGKRESLKRLAALSNHDSMNRENP